MNKIVLLFFSLAILSSFGLFGQIPLVPFNSVTVSTGGSTLANPWAGGLNSPQFSEIDLNNDGKKDLVAFERDFYGSVKTYINTGDNGEISYRYSPEYEIYFPPMRNWMLLRDYNCDGREDIFTSVPGGIRVYKNDPGPGNIIQFNLVTPILPTSGLDGVTPLYVAPPDIPSITDIDGDGDLDILAFNVIGNTLEYHKNLSIENYGNCEELDFELRNACWGYFSEDGNNNTVTLFDTCEVNVANPEKDGRHPGSTVLAIDLTGTGVKDLLIGDITFNNLVMLENGGTTTGSVMVDQNTSFPSGPDPVDITVFPAAYHLDVDNDGLKDLLVAPNNPNTSENYDNIWLYLNKGLQNEPDFIFEQDDFLQEGMIDLGEGSYPVFFDENADGLTDIVAGSYGYFEETASYSSRLMLLRNNGTEEMPEFEVVTDDFAGTGVFNFEGAYPAFGDLDNDQDMDMLLGDEEGKLHFFENVAGPGNPADLQLTVPNYFDIDAGQSAKPLVFDVNRDGLPDLLAGERGGTIRYYENTGSPGDSEFNSLPTIEELGGIDVMPECCTGYSAPFMTYDSLGNTVLYVGSEQGWLYLFNNIDNNLYGNFNLVDSLYLNGVNVNVNGSDINADGRLEFVTGKLSGGFGLLKYGIPPNLGIDQFRGEKPGLRIYPNPARDLINIELPGQPVSTTVQVTIFNMIGKTVHSEECTCSDRSFPVDVSNLETGFYAVVLQYEDQALSGKFIKLE